ncbi:MAG: hypothetical protein QOE31_3084 [Solirubrobacteraceae bacterium]|jgi:hypothetical protein|nr:hypothetical protein [Solirubrobacteraceae bacterium]
MPRATGRDSWEVVGERCADAIVALCRIRAVFESGQMVFDHARRTAQVLGQSERPQITLPDLAEQRDRLARALWGCGHVWRRASRACDGALAAPEIGPALAAGYDEHIAGAGSLVGVDPQAGANLLIKRVSDVMREAMPVLRAAIQVLRPVGEPDLVIVADDLTAVIANLAGQPPASTTS